MKRHACLLLLAAIVGACKGVPPVAGQSRTLAFDTASHGHLRMAAGRVEFCEDGSEPVVSVVIPVAAGKPVDAAMDPGLGLGAIAYERALYCVDTSIVPPEPIECDVPDFPIRRVAVNGRRMIATGKDRLAMYEAKEVGDNTRWELTDWCYKPRKLQRLDLAVPWQQRDYTAVGIFAGEPAVLRVSRRDGPWRADDPRMMRDIEEIAAVRNLGTRIVIFGRRIRTSSVNAQGPASMTVDIRGYTIDSDRLDMRPKMSMASVGGTHAEVTDLAIGSDHVVVVVDRMLMQVYAMSRQSMQWTPVSAPESSRPVDIEWVGGNLFYQFREGSRQPKPMPLESLSP